jgi:2-oxoglutarate ferredoxin oxidoreductase subunit beta
MATFKEFRNNVKPNWCPGCGDFSIQAAIQRAAANVGLEPEELAVIWYRLFGANFWLYQCVWFP